MLLDFTIHNPLADPRTHVSLRTCSSDGYVENIDISNDPNSNNGIPCAPITNNHDLQVTLQASALGAVTQDNIAQVISGTRQIMNHLIQTNSSCNPTVLFANTGSTILGVYTGSQVHSQGLPTAILQLLIDQVTRGGISRRYLLQLCGSNHRGADFAFGIAVSTDTGLDFAQAAVDTWSNGQCVT